MMIFKSVLATLARIEDCWVLPYCKVRTMRPLCPGSIVCEEEEAAPEGSRSEATAGDAIDA
ncbi:MAG: hypothetical protein ACKPKO_08620, partial [Candidatus Fonsibacter sp.]